MKNLIKIGIRVLPVVAVLMLLYIGYLQFYGDRSQHAWFGRKYSEADIQKASSKANNFYNNYYDSLLMLDPELAQQLGKKADAAQWTSMAESHYETMNAFRQRQLKQLNDSIIFEQLDSQAQISYLLLKKELETAIEGEAFRHYNYPVNQMHGVQAELPAFLLNIQRINNRKDAADYLQKINKVNLKFAELLQQLQLRTEKGAIPPKFLFPKLIENVENSISGYPFSANPYKKNIIYQDFENKLNNIPDLSKTEKDSLSKACSLALKTNFGPAYQDLLLYLKEIEQKANNQAGVWKLQDGDKYYAYLLRKETTTELSPDDIYDLGMEEIERIHKEMRSIIQKVKFNGNLNNFFEFMRKDPQFYYPNTPAGKAAYLAKTKEIIEAMQEKLPALFSRQPKAALEVKAVEAYREKSAGKAFYQPPAADGSRPGIYYVNTYDMRMVPKYQMEALAYHEAIPGHHMQLSIAQELDYLPDFRRYGYAYNAYVEGWGLYSEYLPKELGFYQDPYSDFGRLAMELWRACRLVVDVGIHSKRWTREQAIQFYKSNSPNSELDCIKMVDRHIVMPAQATSYKIGMISILELKSKAEKALAEQFDIRDFHSILLENAALPLDLLEDLVDAYIKEKKNEIE